jgi:endonuclease G
MKKFITLFLVLISTSIFSKICDTILKNDAYTSYISYQVKQPIQVDYKLYKGGGDCSRKKFRFKNDTKIDLLKKQYKRSGFDRGHLANAKDFAFDCVKDEKTFRYYNCLPQTPNLNRGIWKRWETKIRKESQTDSLLIMCGGIWTDSLIVKGIRVPDHCWKVVYSLSKKEATHILLFANIRKGAWCEEVSMCELERRLGYSLKFD